jgi:hypothetical protein
MPRGRPLNMEHTHRKLAWRGWGAAVAWSGWALQAACSGPPDAARFADRPSDIGSPSHDVTETGGDAVASPGDTAASDATGLADAHGSEGLVSGEDDADEADEADSGTPEAQDAPGSTADSGGTDAEAADVPDVPDDAGPAVEVTPDTETPSEPDVAADTETPPPCMALGVPGTSEVPGPTFDVLHGGAGACYEAWFRSAGGDLPTIAFSQGANVAGMTGWLLYCFSNTLYLDVYIGGTVKAVVGVTGCEDGAFHHVAACFGSATFELWYDGVSLGTNSGVPDHRVLPFHIGSWGSYVGGRLATVDEVRVSTTRRYTSAFAPAVRLAADADTLLLHHFDEGAGTTTANASGGEPLTLPSATLWSPSCP